MLTMMKVRQQGLQTRGNIGGQSTCHQAMSVTDLKIIMIMIIIKIIIITESHNVSCYVRSDPDLGFVLKVSVSLLNQLASTCG